MTENRRRRGPWTVLTQREVYADPWVRVRRDEVLRPDGQPGSYCVVNLKPGVTVLAIDGESKVWLTEEFHYGVGRTTLECVSGGVEPDEDPAIAARRELSEELGIAASRWTELGTCDPFTANVVSPTRLYLAEGLSFGAASTDAGEVIQPRQMAFEEAVAAVFSGEITHAPSCLAIMMVALQRRAT